jgi:glycosyltransferase involved in cell wall biosynthesis
MREPIVSVLSITYNHAPYIAHAIESFLSQQTTFPFEIVIGEDYSTDETREIVLDFARRYPHMIRVVISERNVGVVPNFLRTFAACRGKYVAMCEGDDYWHHPQKLQRQIDFLEENPEFGMVHTDFDTVFINSSKVVTGWFAAHNVSFRHESDVHVPMLLGEYPVSTCTYCFRRDLLAEVVENDPVGFGGTFSFCDLQMKTGLAFRKKVGYLPESMATYRHLHESASHSKNPARELAWTESCAELHDHLCALYRVDDATRARIRDKWVHSRLAAAFRANDRDAALRAYTSLSQGMSMTHLKSAVYVIASQYNSVRSALHHVLRWRASA